MASAWTCWLVMFWLQRICRSASARCDRFARVSASAPGSSFRLAILVCAGFRVFPVAGLADAMEASRSASVRDPGVALHFGGAFGPWHRDSPGPSRMSLFVNETSTQPNFFQIVRGHIRYSGIKSGPVLKIPRPSMFPESREMAFPALQGDVPNLRSDLDRTVQPQ